MRTMADVTLRDVTRENWKECVALKVADDQAAFVAPNLWSLAEAKFETQCVPQAIYDGERMVGFAMYAVEEGTGWLIRLMVDAAHQGRGAGRAATLEVIRRLRADPAVRRIRLGCVEGNDAAARLYRSLGFVETGEMEHNEAIMELREPVP
jgi:diamine N-acetyltransferase